MGLATPAAMAVGFRTRRQEGILFRNASSLESFRHIKQVVFDKTGTLTTGKFNIGAFEQLRMSPLQTHRLFPEKFSNHPVAMAISRNGKSTTPSIGCMFQRSKAWALKQTDKKGISTKRDPRRSWKQVAENGQHNIYITRNGNLLGWIDVQDEIRPMKRNRSLTGCTANRSKPFY